MGYSPVYPDIELTTQQRINKEEYDKKCRICIFYCLLCFGCLMLIQGIVAFIIIEFYGLETYENKPQFNVTEG